MSDRFKGCLFGLLWALAALVLVCAIHLRDIARDIHAIRQSLERPAPKVETYEPIRRAYAAWAAVKDTPDTGDAYYWATKNLIDTLRDFKPPAIADADRHSIGEKEPK
jgi:hypothetical protein